MDPLQRPAGAKRAPEPSLAEARARFHDVLVHVPDYRAWPPHTVCAIRLAARHHARLTGLYALDLPFTPEELARAQEEGTFIARAEKALVEAELAAPEFAELARAGGVSTVEWRVGRDAAAMLMAYAGSLHDVLVLGVRDGFRKADAALAARIVIESRSPCLLVPPAAEHAGPDFDTVAIGWNGSLESLRAIHAAMPLIERAANLVVLQCKADELPRAVTERPVLELGEYFDAHGVTASRRTVDDVEGAELARLARAAGADLLVMGAYGHSRLREWLFEGATRTALDDGGIPLLLHH